MRPVLIITRVHLSVLHLIIITTAIPVHIENITGLKFTHIQRSGSIINPNRLESRILSLCSRACTHGIASKVTTKNFLVRPANCRCTRCYTLIRILLIPIKAISKFTLNIRERSHECILRTSSIRTRTLTIRIDCGCSILYKAAKRRGFIRTC